MKRVILYHTQVIFGSTLWWGLAVLTVCLSGATLTLAQPSDAEVAFPRSLAAVQTLLLVSAWMQGIYLPWLAVQAVGEARESGLLEWWMSSGVPAWMVALGQATALVALSVGYQWFVVLPGLIWLLAQQGSPPWSLLFQQELLSGFGSVLQILVGIFLATCWPRLAAFLGSLTLTLLSWVSSSFIFSLVDRLPDPFRLIFLGGWELIPRFALFTRPMALVYHWEILPWSLMFSLIVYSLIYVTLLLMGCEVTYRHRYAT